MSANYEETYLLFDNQINNCVNNTESTKRFIEYYKNGTFITAYPTRENAYYIKNAESGGSYKCRVGSKKQDNYFKVKLLHDKKFNNGNNTFFYSTPNGFTNHQLLSVDKKNKINWANRNI